MSKAGMWTTICMIVLGIVDAVLVNQHGVDGSISRWVQDTGYASPVFVLMIGFLLGHFFGYMPPKCKIDKDKDESEK